MGEGSEGKLNLVICWVEGNRMMISVKEGAVVKVEASYVSRNRENGVVFSVGRGQRREFWR